MAAQRPRSSNRTRAELWVWPGIAAAVALAVGLLLTELEPEVDLIVGPLAWPGDVNSASTVLQVVAGAAVSILTLTFSLTIVALQLASQQFSPRLLRDFMGDRMTKAVLAALIGSFVFTVTVQRRLDTEDGNVPAVAMLVAMGLALGALAALLAFIQHISSRLRVETMMLVVHDETTDTIDAFYADHDDDDVAAPGEVPEGPREGTTVTAARSGFVRSVDIEGLVGSAREHDAVVRVEVRPGDHVVRGTPVAVVARSVGRETARPFEGAPPDGLVDEVREAVDLAYERTPDQDVAYGFRQLTDIAVRALSPAKNDPVTAAHALGHTADLLTRLLEKRLGPSAFHDDDEVLRAVLPDRDLRYFLDMACGGVRRYGRTEPTVLVAVLRLLRDVAVHCRHDEQRVEIERQVVLVVEEIPDSYSDVERRTVEDMAERVRAALRGRVGEAFTDRAGETRSI